MAAITFGPESKNRIDLLWNKSIEYLSKTTLATCCTGDCPTVRKAASGD